MLNLLVIDYREFFGGVEKNYIKLFRLLKNESWLNIKFLVVNEHLYNELKKEGADVYAVPKMDTFKKFVSLDEYKKMLNKVKTVAKELNPDFILVDDGTNIEEFLDFKVLLYIEAKNTFSFEYFSKNQNRFRYAIAGSLPLYNYAKNFINKEKLLLIPYWIEEIENKPKTFNDIKEFRIGWVSRLISEKGWEDLVEGFKDTDIIVDFIGTGPDYDKAKNIANNYNNLNFLGFIEQEPREYLKEKTSVYVFSSRVPGEGFGLTQIEAMSVGIPCIAYRTDVSEYVLGKDGLFYENIDELKNLIFRLKEDKNFYNEQAQYSLERVKIFSKEQAKEKFLNLFKKLSEEANQWVYTKV